MGTLTQPLATLQPFVMYPGNTFPVLWALVAGATGMPVLDATGTLTVYDPSGAPVPGATSISSTSTTPAGTYEFLINGSLFNPEPGQDYSTIIEMSSVSAGGVGRWTVSTIIRPRTRA